MNKKLLTSLTVFFAMALTACNLGPKSQEEEQQPASSEQPATSIKHQHTFDENTWASNETQHWHPATCEHTDAKGDAKAHSFVKDESKQSVPATCAQAGVEYQKCSVCGYQKTVELPKTAHDWAATDQAAREETGFATLSQYKCSYGDHYALRWLASDFDEEATIAACGLEAKDSTYYPEINTSGSHSGSIRLKKAEYNNQDTHVGTHVIYKVKVGAAVQDADLEFEIDPKSGFDVHVFDYVSNDDQQGYRKLGDDDTLTLTTKRYGLRVNGQEIELGEDLHGDVNGGSHLWFNWNVKVNLQQGENVIDVYCLGGYRAYIYNFQLTGLPANA